MAVDIFNPEVSQVVKGIEGKLILIYGTNSTGKTKNLTKANKPLVCCFENGLGAINGIKNVKIKKWSDWTSFVKQLTSEKTVAEAKKLYSSIIIDTVDGMADLAAEFICGNFGVARINDGNRGYGLWKEYGAEINKYLKLLTNAGYTVFFIAHEGERTFQNERGEECTKIYPRGDKRVIDPICDLCDIIGYAQIQPDTEDGEEVLSTLYLKGSPAYHARSRFVHIVKSIPEWNIQKLDQAISDAIEAEENESGMKAVTIQEAQKKAAKARKAEAEAKLPLEDLIDSIGTKLQAMNEKTGSIDEYAQLMDDLGIPDTFKATNANESQRQQLEMLLGGLVELGY